MTAKTARYFFSWGPHRKHGDAALRDTLMGIAHKAFEEDRTMIEAQQRVIDVTPVLDRLSSYRYPLPRHGQRRAAPEGEYPRSDHRCAGAHHLCNKL